MYELASLLHSCLCRHIAYRDRTIHSLSYSHTHTLINCIQPRMTMATAAPLTTVVITTEIRMTTSVKAIAIATKPGTIQKTGKKRTTEATKRTKYHELRQRDMPLYASYIPYYNPIQRNSIVKKRCNIFLALFLSLPLTHPPSLSLSFFYNSSSYNALRPNTLTASRK